MSKIKNKSIETGFELSSGNVFADLDLENPEELLLKSRLVLRINRTIENKAWTQKEAAKALGLKQPNISELSRGKLDHFSVERLLRLLVKLDNEVVITIRPQTKTADTKEEKILISA